MTKFKKTFSAAAIKLKLEIFKKNVDKVTAHNAAKNMKFKLAINQFADLSSEEFKKMYLGLKVPASAYRALIEAKAEAENTSEAEMASLMEIAADVEAEAEAEVEGVDKPKKKSKKELKAEAEAAAKAAAEKAAAEKAAKEAADKAAADKAAAEKAAAEKAIADEKASFESFKAIDWVAAGKVGKVKNQGGCGSCWSYGTMATIESALAITNGGEVPILAEQALVSCDTNNYACNGGWYTAAYNWVIKNGIFTEANWPYKATKGTCDIETRTKSSLTISGQKYRAGSDQALYAAVTQGPAAVAVDAGYLQFYSTGLYSHVNCTNRVSHAVVLVGAGKLSAAEVTRGSNTIAAAAGDRYWLIRNSWGTTWGEKGYFRMPVTGASVCGIHTAAYNAVV